LDAGATPRRSTSSLDTVKLLVFPALFLCGTVDAYAGGCLDYNAVELRGVLSTKTFPGPPNYKSVSSGDAEETYFFITLARSACVLPGKSELEPAIKSINTIQLTFDWQTARQSYDSLRPSLGATVKCTGVLLGRHTGHHHTKVMLTSAVCNGI
jgi:hypothetical protein